jgi:hypothetical protein
MVHYGVTTTYWDAYLDKFDAHEDREWANSSLGGISWGGWGSQIYPQSVQQTSDGGYIVGGYSYSVSNGNYIGWIEKYDPEGNSN